MSTQAYRYAQAMAVTERARGRAEEERAWLDLLALLDAPAPAPSEAADTVVTPPIMRIEGTWLAEFVDEHTCGAGPGSGTGIHEPGCGLVPVIDLATLPGWDEHLTAAPAPSVMPEAPLGDLDALDALVGVAKIGLPLEERRMVDEHAAQIRAALTVPSVVPEAAVEAFKAAWHKADDEGRAGERVRDGLAAALPLLTAAPSATRDEVAEALGVVWDDGNGTGLDGWVGPGRGAGEVDHEAVRARDRAVDRALRVIATAPSATREEDR